MTKNAKIITLVVIMLVALILSIVMVSVYATTHDDQVSSNGFIVTKTGNTCVITGYEGKDETVKIPQKVAGKKVVGIKPGVFKNNTVKIKNIEFNGKFEGLVLDPKVFEGLNDLLYVKLPDGLKQIPESAFLNCPNLTHIKLPASVEVIGDYAFQKCNKLKYTTGEINDGLADNEKKFFFNQDLVRVGKSAFESCVNIATLVLNDKLEYIGDSAFQNASNLTKIEVGEECLLSTIGDYAFASTRIESRKPDKTDYSRTLVFPNLQVIGKGAFANITSNFSYFELRDTIKTIKDEAFMGSSYLTSIVYEENFAPEEFGKGVFKNCTALSTFAEKVTEGIIINNAIPKKMTVIPELTFSGCYNLLLNQDFKIHKDVKEIKDGAFALYNYKGNDLRQQNTHFNVLVDPQNTNFKMIKLESYKRGNSTNNPDHYVLVAITNNGLEMVAYFGNYTTYTKDATSSTYSDAYRITDMNGNIVDYDVAKKIDYTAFTFLHQNTELRHGLKTIRPYAFAGVKFNSLLIPNQVDKICDNAFFGSDITMILFDKPDCLFEENAFAGLAKDFSSPAAVHLYIGTTHGNENGTIAKQAKILQEEKICIYSAGHQMFL